jgi:hypothetical protein
MAKLETENRSAESPTVSGLLTTPASGQRRSGYKVIGLVGQGQYGRVFCALERRTGELKALKELDKNRFPTKQFLRELRFLVSLRHPNIVACAALEHGTHHRHLVMEYCEGGTLRGLMENEGKLSLRHSLKIVIDILQGLEYAHSQGIVHCDIKPENILLQVQPDGWLAKISDFGVARLQNERADGNGDTGSPAYMAPERFYGKHDYASDIYAVGVILYELLTGERPFSGIPKELLQAHLSQPLQLPSDIPFLLRSTLTTALQKLPQSRFASATDMLKSMRLAEAVVVATNRPEPLLAATDLGRGLTFQAIEQEVLTTPVTQLAVSDQQVILGRVKQAECRWYQGGILRGNLKQTWRVAFSQSLTKIQQLAEIQLTPKGCWLMTKARLPIAATRSSQRREFNLYFLPLTHTGLAQAVGLAQDCPELYTLMTLQAEQMLIAADPQGRWLAYSADQALEANQVHLLRGEHALKLKVQSSQITSRQLSALQPLSHRYGLAVSHQATSEGAQVTQLQIFSRWGRQVGQFQLPMLLQHLTPNLRNPGQFLALDAEDATVGILAHLYPWKVDRIAFGLVVRWLQPTPWGYLAASEEGQVLLLNFFGEKLFHFQVPGKITALTTFDKFGLMVATWGIKGGRTREQSPGDLLHLEEPLDYDHDDQEEISEGLLYKIDLSKLGFDFRGYEI